MMTRKERRAADHAARKAAYKAARQGAPTPTTSPVNTPETIVDPTIPAHGQPCAQDQVCVCDDASCPACQISFAEAEALTAPPKPPISPARLAANRQNAKLSTGPQSDAMKAKVSLNALKTGLTGRTVVLPFDDRDAYEDLLLSYQKEFTPIGPVEKGLVQSLVDTCWRLERIPGLEYALLETGYNQIGHANPTATLAAPEPTIELQIRAIHEKTFRNLQLQENRLVRRRGREMKELRGLQETRKANETEELKIAAQAALVAQHYKQTFNLAELGFEFSTQRLAVFMARLTPVAKQNLLKEALAEAAATASAA